MIAGVDIGRLAGAVLAAALALPAAAAAQGPPSPFADLFGRTPPQTGRELTRVEMRTTVGGQYDGALAEGGVTANPSAGPTAPSPAAARHWGSNAAAIGCCGAGCGSRTYQEFYAAPQTRRRLAMTVGMTAMATVTTKLTVEDGRREASRRSSNSRLGARPCRARIVRRAERPLRRRAR